MRAVFAGTPPFAARALEAIRAAGHDIPLVLTLPDRPAGRKLLLSESAVSQTAERLGIPVAKFASLRDPEAVPVLEEARAEVMIVAAYGLLLPREILGVFPLGCVNVHASLLPRWRGAAPIQRAILAGDAITGITIMQMDEGLDTGDMLLQLELPISDRDTGGTLTVALAELGGRAITSVLEDLPRRVRRAQDPVQASYARKIAKSEARVDWALDCRDVDRMVRAFNPVPGAETQLGGEKVKIWECRLSEATGAPGSVLVCEGDALVLACGQGALEITMLQRAGGRRMAPGEFLRGARIFKGMVSDPSPPKVPSI